jgi:hypothetical protein
VFLDGVDVAIKAVSRELWPMCCGNSLAQIAEA